MNTIKRIGARTGLFLLLLLILPVFLNPVRAQGPERSADETTNLSGFITTMVERSKKFEDVGDRSLALDAAGHPHIAFGSDHLYHAWNDGAGWLTETVDRAEDVGRFASLALDSSGHAHISYYDQNNHDLKYAYQDDNGWHIQIVDRDGNVGQYGALALDSSGRAHISYYDFTHRVFKYARQDGGSWNIETLEPLAEGHSTWNTAIAIDASDQPHIIHSDYANSGGHEWNGELRYAHKNNEGWHFETAGLGREVSLALDDSDMPHISYRNRAWRPGAGYRDELWYGYKDSDGWHSEKVCGYWAGDHNSLVLDASGRPHISYHGSGAIEYATRGGDGWRTEQVDAISISGREYYEPFTSLALDNAGSPVIIYSSNDALEYAWKPALSPLISHQVTTPPIIDGDLNDWSSDGEVTLDAMTARIITGDQPSHYDLSATIRSRWDDNNLYFALSVFDNRLVTDSAEMWNDDQIELDIDGLLDHEPNGADDHQYIVAADGRKADREIPGNDFQAVVRARNDGWNVEIAIPASNLHAGPLEACKALGFNFGLHDDDDGGPYDTRLLWTPKDTSATKAGWGLLRLDGAVSTLSSPPQNASSGGTITLQQGFLAYAGAADAEIGEYSSKNYGSRPMLELYADDSNALLLRYDLSALPADATIERATLSLYSKRRRLPFTIKVNIYALLRDWKEDEVTWQQAANGNPWQIPGAEGPADRESAVAAAAVADQTGSWVSFDVTGLVQRWQDGSLQNLGVILKSESDYSESWNHYTLVGSDAPDSWDAPYRPELIVSYEEPAPTPVSDSLYLPIMLQ